MSDMTADRAMEYVAEAFMVVYGRADHVALSVLRARLARSSEGKAEVVNHCIEVAAAALKYLAENDMPKYGNARFNSEHCHQLSHELRLTNSRLTHPAPAKVNRQDRIAVSRALDGLKDRLFDANALDAEAMALHSAGSDAFFRITAPTSNKE